MVCLFFYKIVVDAVVLCIITTKWLGKGGLSPSPLKIFQKMRSSSQAPA